MASNKVQPERIRSLREGKPRDGKYVLYWMQQSQRAQSNHALEFAVQQANQLDQRLLVAFGLMDNYPEGNERHYRFMLEGLAETQRDLMDRHVKMVVQLGRPDDVAIRLSKDASVLVCDRGYLRHQKQWRENVADQVRCPVYQVESDVVVPVDVASDKREYAARTIRPKLQSHHDRYLVKFRATPISKDSRRLSVDSLDLSQLDVLLAPLKLDGSVKPVNKLFVGGPSQAKRIFRRFVKNLLGEYRDHRNRPETDDVSHMSKYLHFGQISPIWLASEVSDVPDRSKPDRDAFLEELLIRRELAQNFVNFTDDYDAYSCLPTWAKQTLENHKTDARPHRYTRQQLEDAQTDDAYWNAAMREMRYTGYMHNYMRMYWGKKILEWSNTPQYAYRVALELNNKYFLDGRDPNSYANIAWIFGNHDRAFGERRVFGKVRYMSVNGLKRKCDADAYVSKVDKLVESATAQ